MKITLTAEQKQQLEEQHKAEDDGRIRDRIKAVLLSSEGWTQRQIATAALRGHKTTVWGHLKHLAGGVFTVDWLKIMRKKLNMQKQ